MRYFLDTEFIEKPNTIDLISIGIVSEDDREFYRISSEYNYHSASDWVKENVIRQMYDDDYEPYDLSERKIGINCFHQYIGKSLSGIKKDILKFIGDDEKPEFWAYFASYDWVVFCWIFGSMIDLPWNCPLYCHDLKQEADRIGNPHLKKPKKAHNALEDAKWNKKFYDFLVDHASKNG